MAVPESASVCEKLLDLEEGLEIWRISPLRLHEQEKNARVQSHHAFTSLARNVKTRGALESMPFVSRQGDTFWIISGHHRVRAAIQAELTSIVVLVDPSPRTRSEIVAKQLAHNVIQGKDDPAVLLQLVAEIEDIEAMIEAAVDRAAIEKQIKQDISVPDIQVDFDWKTVQLAFLPTQVKDLEAVAAAMGDADLVGVVDAKVYADFMAVMKRLGKAQNIRSLGAIVYRMVEITRAHLDAEAARAGEHDVA
jgi:hypothetical protein